VQLSSKYSDGAAMAAINQFLWARWDIPVGCVVLYLCIVYLTRNLIAPHRFGRIVDASFAAWNLGLSVFSAWGVWHMSRPLFSALRSEGLFFTVCAETKAFTVGYGSENPFTFALVLFCLSKIPELGDTAFLILKRKQVRLLQWYHHTTVLLFCWLALATEYTPGIWFAATNYSVHAIMYMYFFLMTFKRTANIVKPIAPWITIIQITQMVWGLVVNTIAVSSYFRTGACQISGVTAYCSVVMYGSYFWLFTKLYLDSKRAAGGKNVRRALSRKISQALLNESDDEDNTSQVGKKVR